MEKEGVLEKKRNEKGIFVWVDIIDTSNGSREKEKKEHFVCLKVVYVIIENKSW